MKKRWTTPGRSVEAVEIGTGGYPGDAYYKPGEPLADPGATQKLRRAVESMGLEISALSCHGNPLHPELGLSFR